MTYKDPETVEALHWLLLQHQLCLIPGLYAASTLETHPEHQTELRLKSKASCSRAVWNLKHLGFGLTFYTAKPLSCAILCQCYRISPPCATIIRISIFIPHAPMLPFIFSELQWMATLQQNARNLLTAGTLWLRALALTAGDLMPLSRFSTTTGRLQGRVFFGLAVDKQAWELTLIVMVGVLVNSLCLPFLYAHELTEI